MQGASTTGIRGLAAILEETGAPAGAAWIVHAGFRGLSRAGLRCEAVIESLLDAPQVGSLLMPAMSWRLCTADNPLFDECTTPAITGALSETFRTRYATHRSLHPTHSVCGNGPDAASLLGSHHLGTTPCGPLSPFAKLEEADGWILLLGTGFETCTTLHVVEEAWPDLYFRPPDGVIYTCRDRHGSAHPVTTRRHAPLKRDFPRLAALATVHRGSVLDVPWQACRVRDLLAQARQALASNPRATLLEAFPGSAFLAR